MYKAILRPLEGHCVSSKILSRVETETRELLARTEENNILSVSLIGIVDLLSRQISDYFFLQKSNIKKELLARPASSPVAGVLLAAVSATTSDVFLVRGGVITAIRLE